MEENSKITAKVRGTPFPEGKSGNPNGRPLGQRNYATIYREALIKLAEINGKEPEELENEILSNALLSARKGDYRFYKDILDRLFGTPVQKTELTGKDGKDLIPDSISKEKAEKAIDSYLNDHNKGNSTNR